MSEAPKLKIRRTLVMLFILSLLSVGAYVVETLSAFLFALIPLAYTIPAFIWLVRLEPEPRAMFAFLLLGHIVLFVIVVRRMRRAEIELVRSRVQQLAFSHNLSPVEFDAYGNLRATRHLRRGLARKDRPAFDEYRVMLTKLALREQQV